MYLFGVADAVRLPFPDRSVDLVFGSPPYLDCRTYGIGAQRDCAAWIQWMLDVTTEACRVSRGLVLWVVAGVVRQHCYQPGPEGLLYEWWKRGGMAWRPCYWYRSGIPGSGHQHWLRADVEYVLAFVGPDRRPRRGRPATHSKRKDRGSWSDITIGGNGKTIVKTKAELIKPRAEDCGEPAPDDPNTFWTDNTAMGHPPKYATSENEFGLTAKVGNDRDGRVIRKDFKEGFWTDNTAMGHKHRGNYKNNISCREVHGGRFSLKYDPPTISNPGNLIETTEDEGFWTDNTAMGHAPKTDRPTLAGGNIKGVDGHLFGGGRTSPVLANPGNLIKTNSGYGSMGSSHAHDNEAPFPEALAEFFIRTACPPGGIVLDPFSGSGTTVAVAERLGRVGLGFDIRRSQCELGVRRITRPHSQRKRTGHREDETYPLFS